jgi:hypothetical protein
VSDPFFTYGVKRLLDGRVLTVDPLTFGRARLHISSAPYFYDDGW